MSTLYRILEEYLAVRKSLGFRMENESRCLPDFINFVESKGSQFVTVELSVKWAKKPEASNPAYWSERLCFVRQFAKYLSAIDPRHEVASADLLPHRYRRRKPYIYTDAEIMRLVKAAEAIPTYIRAVPGLRSGTYTTILGLLASTGLRVSEALALNRADFDAADGVLAIRDTKFHKSRLVPLHASTQDALLRYAKLRDRLIPKPKTLGFFASERGERPAYMWTQTMFVRLSRQVGLRAAEDRHGPRLHDLRHRFAVKTLLNWYRNGVDVEQHLPELSTYLGHVSISCTYWYLTATPELLELAGRRAEQSWKES